MSVDALEPVAKQLYKEMIDPKPCLECFDNFHNNEYSPCDENLHSEHCKTLIEWKKRQILCVDSTKGESK